MLNGGGQRSQAYCQLQCPPLSAVRSLSKDVESSGCFTLPALREKRARHVDVPDVVLPGAVYPFVAFHVEYVRPYLLKGRSSEEFHLLIDTRFPAPLKPGSILGTVRQFLKNEDPELACLTLANIRSSFTTMAVIMYKRGKMFKEMSEGFF